MLDIAAIKSRFATIKHDHIDFHVIVDPTVDGPVIGFYGEQPIAAAILDHAGRRLVFHGIAPLRRDGGYDVTLLRAGEFVIEPGFVYRLETAPAARAA
ncbi:MAG TPA: hypothetical protein VHA10_03300 [Hypericibacter adhaerens]|jgi:hypothetical protein|uniref:Uncharacterized protein n=1 Tax=Hypericibacter adhaerens TaxID=2602016 RepID=A0A5J6MTQ8_9PROT|nr:hypothetical protein [Hypericibacter adhaerens]QEX20978.1 hypothetical protein FRZ61_08980 [Hypericibacter adhaerens]HWA42210.1 hypothetical protein [Hypericibacter adhaerens]